MLNYIKTIMHNHGLSMDKKTHARFVKSMFGAIAPRYDFLNRLLSLRQDVSWRRRMVAGLDLPEDGRVLDAACGTGDVALEILRQKKTPQIRGIDFSPEMLAIAANKTARARPGAGVFLLAADALQTPFAANAFDAVTIAFGIRNILNRQQALEEFCRVLKPGGILAVLELTTPAPGPLRSLYLLYFEKILPAVGGVFSKNIRAYRYLPASVLRFPQPAEFGRLMRHSGFCDVQWLKLSAGIATLYTGRKRLG